MAFRDWVGRARRAIGRAISGKPSPPPPPQPPARQPLDWLAQGPTTFEAPSRPDRLPWQYILPEPIQPTEYGVWPVDEEEDIGGYAPIYDDSGLYGGEPDEMVTLYDRNLQPIEYNRVTGDTVQLSADQWYRETFRPQEALLEEYGIDNIDILKDLYDQGYIDDDDWDTWREIYGEMFA